MTRHKLVVTRNTTLEEVSCKGKELFVSENTLYRCVDGFNKDNINFFTTNNMGDHFLL